MSHWPCDRYFVQLKIKNQLWSLWNTFYTESPRNITINTVIILILLIYEMKVEKYTKIFTRAIENWHCIKQLPAEYSCLARTSLWWFQAVLKASSRWQHTTEVGYICSLCREARKSEVGHICPTGHERDKLDLVGVQEVRWDGGDTERAGEYTFSYG
jgi:hypothetical protein